jgi:molecular chaperone Hsp33
MHDHSKDTLIHFIFNEKPVHGAIVTLDDSYLETLNRHPYTPEAQRYLGEALATVSLLSLKLKGPGSIILQTQSDGPVSLLLAQVNNKNEDVEIRGLLNSTDKISGDFSTALGNGHLAITQLPENYQGVVKLHAKNLSKIIENYFYQSEQVPTYALLCANAERAFGIFLQCLPSHQEQEDGKNYWEHILTLAETLTEKEALSVSNEEILYRLFHEEKLQILNIYPIKFSCRCSRDSMSKAIVNLGREDARKLLSEQNNKKIKVTCEFCNAQTEFDSIDVENIFNQEPPHERLS